MRRSVSVSGVYLQVLADLIAEHVPRPPEQVVRALLDARIVPNPVLPSHNNISSIIDSLISPARQQHVQVQGFHGMMNSSLTLNQRTPLLWYPSIFHNPPRNTSSAIPTAGVIGQDKGSSNMLGSTLDGSPAQLHQGTAGPDVNKDTDTQTRLPRVPKSDSTVS